VTVEWRKLHNDELNDLYTSPNIVRVINSRRMRWAGHVARMGERRGVYRVLVGKPDGKRPLWTRKHRWEDNIKIDQIKHQLDATLCRFYFCRVTLHVSGVRRSSSGVLKNWHGGPWYRCYSCR